MRIVLTGPESTAKSTLCRNLSQYYKGSMIPEFARSFLEDQLPVLEYTLEDVIYIGEKQYDISKNSSINNLIFEDTDLVNILVWLRLKFDHCDLMLEDKLSNFPPDLYLICLPDIEWSFDPLRDFKGNRLLVLKEHIKVIKKFQTPFRFVSGLGRKRLTQSIFHLDDYISSCTFAP
ncbi:MAG: ATP-binding protein [Saprospiraceae bacterium]|nr:ATP-binding protein [Saprospiraceae bacterium]